MEAFRREAWLTRFTRTRAVECRAPRRAADSGGTCAAAHSSMGDFECRCDDFRGVFFVFKVVVDGVHQKIGELLLIEAGQRRIEVGNRPQVRDEFRQEIGLPIAGRLRSCSASR